MKASDLFIKALENEKVEYIFAVPGEENLDFIESLRNSNIRLITTRHEQTAGFMAATYGRLTGKAGVCLSTLGPGATNLVTPAAYAFLGAMPMVMITGQKPIKKSKQGLFQIINVVEMMKPITKFTKQIVNGNSISSLVREAFKIAENERPGSVHLELPEDVAREDVDTEVFEVMKVRRPVAEKKAIENMVEMLKNAKTPLILIGAGANRKLTGKMLTEFIDKTGIYFFNTQMGKGVVDERHPMSLGTAALSDGDYLHCAIKKADLIINVGHDVIEKPPFFMENGSVQKVVHVNFAPADVNNIYFPQLEVIGDIANAIWQVKESIDKSDNWDFSYFEKVKKEMDSRINNNSNIDVVPMLPQHIVSQVRQAMPDDGIIALDNGMYKIWFARNYKAYEHNTVLLDNAFATMGAGLPSAMAAKLTFPEKKVLAVCGDGGFMMNSQDIETACREKIDLVVIIINDSGYGMIKWKQEGMGFEGFGLDFKNPDFVKYAESYGAGGHRVSKDSKLVDLINQSFEEGGVHIIDVPVDYSENKTVLIDELNQIKCLL